MRKKPQMLMLILVAGASFIGGAVCQSHLIVTKPQSVS